MIASLFDQVRRSVAQRGLVGTMQMCMVVAMALVMPAGRRVEALRRHADESFDQQYGVETGGIHRPRPGSVLGANWSFGVRYQAVNPAEFIQALEKLDLPHEEFTFLDFGSGKGRALLLASGFPFRRVMGVEYCEELNRIARRNLERYPAALQRCDRIEIAQADAADFCVPDGPLVLFFFNPFGRPVMEKVVANVAESFQAKPRRIVVIYCTPYFSDLWEEAGFLRRIQDSPAIFDSGAV
jgi:SAM-dependent methyltransferase